MFKMREHVSPAHIQPRIQMLLKVTSVLIAMQLLVSPVMIWLQNFMLAVRQQAL